MDISPIGTNQRVIVICVRYTDATTTRMAQASDWATLLNNQVNSLYSRATYNQTNFTFEVPIGGPADGWYDLGHASSGYSFNGTGQEAIRLADPDVDFSMYNRVVVITNWPGFGGQGRAGHRWAVGEGVEFWDMRSTPSVGQRVLSLSVTNEWVASSHGEVGDAGAAVIAHELGHHLRLQTHYGDVRYAPGLGRDSITPWDLMGKSPMQRHFLGWAKSERGWLAGGRVRTLGPPTTASIDETVRLKPLENNTSTGTQLIKVPFLSSGAFEGLVLENRQQVNGDEQLPAAGLLVSLVDESPDVWYGFKDIVMMDPDAPRNLDQAPLGVGQSYREAEYGINIGVVSQTGANLDVRVRYPLPPSGRPDPAITNWGAPPWDTVDIWIDSEKNGWDTYRYRDTAGNPVGQGDAAWVNHDNRVYVRIRNLGTRIANNVRVQVFVNQPPGMGDAGPDWVPVGTILFGSVPVGGMPVQDFVLWKPTVASHTCIRAIIDDSPGELSTSNNRAQENVALFETSARSPWEPISLEVRVYNPLNDQSTVAQLQVTDVPEGWGISIDPPELELGPGDSGLATFMAFPAGPPDVDDPRIKKYQAGFIGKPRVQALVPYADTFVPIGGVDVWVHLVNWTDLDIKAEVDEKGVVVFGQLSPAILKAPIAIELSRKRAKPLIRHASTDQDGSFRARIPVKNRSKLGGRAVVQAYFDGDETQRSAESQPVEIELPRMPGSD